jgi:hypothetical protein
MRRFEGFRKEPPHLVHQRYIAADEKDVPDGGVELL